MKVMVEQPKFAVPQKDMAPTFWDPMGNLGNKVMSCSDPADDAYFKNLIKTTVANVRDEPEADYPMISGLYSTEDGIEIYWRGVSDAYAYRVFYRGSNGWKRLGDTRSTHLTDTVVSFGKTYNYTVRCIDRYGNYTSDYYSPGWYGTYAAEVPEITSLTSNASGITIKWYPVYGVQKYRVYYKNSNGTAGAQPTASQPRALPLLPRTKTELLLSGTRVTARLSTGYTTRTQAATGVRSALT